MVVLEGRPGIRKRAVHSVAGRAVPNQQGTVLNPPGPTPETASGRGRTHVERRELSSYRLSVVGLLERDDQIATLVRLFEDVGEAGRLVLIAGEAGAGKSVLLLQFVTKDIGTASV